MLTSTGRAAARRVLSTRASPKLITQRLVITRRSVLSAAPARSFSLTRWVREAQTVTKAAKAKKPAAAKATKKVAAKKPAAKKALKKKPAVKKKPAPVVRKKKTPEEKAAVKAAALKKSLKEASLRKEEPIKAPKSGWNIFVKERSRGTGGKVTDNIAEISSAYKSLSVSEQEGLQKTTVANKVAAEEEYHAWIKSHHTEVIYTANLARAQLRKLNKGSPSAARIRNLDDPRLPAYPANAYARFVRSQFGNYAVDGGNAGDAGRELGAAWQTLPAGEKKVYTDAADAGSQLYAKEMGELKVASKAYRKEKGYSF